jgi:hypothetical protein
VLGVWFHRIGHDRAEVGALPPLLYFHHLDHDRVFRGFDDGRLVGFLNPRHAMPENAVEQPDIWARLRVEIAADNRDRFA